MKKAALQILLDEKRTARVDDCAKRVNITSRADFGETALEFVMPLIESGEMVNLNGRLVFARDLAKHVAKKVA